MHMATKQDIFQEHIEEYLAADKKRKGEILDHVTAVTKMCRESVIRRFRATQLRDGRLPEARGRPMYYTPDVTEALKEVWDVLSEPCGENLHGELKHVVQVLRRDRMWHHSDEATGKLLAMSEGTVKLRVKNFARTRPVTHGKSTTKPSSILNVVPIRMDGWHDAPVGTMQIDTVAHCSASVAGDFVRTVNATDVATLWGTRRAQWNNGAVATTTSLQTMNADLPFPTLEWHPDTGSEFINWHAVRTWEACGIRITRSRPNHKNDNCYVEERNGHIVRAYVGYTRLDVPEVVGALNDLYDVLTPYLNHFIASRRVVSKERIGARWKITREKVSKTPYARILERADVTDDVKARLRKEHAQLNPLMLKRKIDRRLRKVFAIQKRYENRPN